MSESPTTPPNESRPTLSRRIRVLCVNHRDPFHPLAGGAERYLWEVLSRLDPARYEVTWRSEAVRGRPSIEQLGRTTVIRRGGRLSFQLIAPFVARGYDLVLESVAHAIPFHTGLSHRGPRLIILFHVHQSILDRELPRVVAWAARALERTVRFETGTFLAISETTKQEALRVLGVHPPIEVIPPGVQHTFFVPGTRRAAPPDFLFLGRLRRYKRIDTIIAAFSRMGEPGTLTIAGDGDDRERLEEIARHVNGVRLLGPVSEDEKRRLFQEATANVVASEAEGFGLTVLEAGAAGTPTVAVDLPIYREVVRDRISGVLVPENDVPALAQGMRWARDHPELREGAREFALQFSWESTAARFAELLERTLRPPGSPPRTG